MFINEEEIIEALVQVMDDRCALCPNFAGDGECLGCEEDEVNLPCGGNPNKWEQHIRKDVIKKRENIEDIMEEIEKEEDDDNDNWWNIRIKRRKRRW